MESQRVRHDRATFTFTFKIGLPWWLSGKEFVCNGRRHRRRGFDPGVGKIHWRRDRLPTPIFLGFPCGSAGKESAHNVGDLGLISGLGRSPGEGKGYPFQYSGLENSMGCIAHGVAKSQTRLRDCHFYFQIGKEEGKLSLCADDMIL